MDGVEITEADLKDYKITDDEKIRNIIGKVVARVNAIKSQDVSTQDISEYNM